MLYISTIFSPINMNISTISISLIILPFSFINIAISMNQLPVTTATILQPLSLINRSIWPNLLTCTITIPHKPFTIINCSFIQSDWWELGTLLAYFICFLLRFLFSNRFLIKLQGFFRL